MLSESRDRIDAIDDQILSLLISRKNLVDGVFKWKKEAGLPLVDPEREAALLRRLKSKASLLPEDSVVRIFSLILQELKRC